MATRPAPHASSRSRRARRRGGTSGRLDSRRLDRDSGELAQEEPGPAVDVVLGHHVAHPRHPRPPLVLGHLQGRADRLGGPGEVVRVDDERVPQLVGRAREPAQDEHAVLVVANRDELLGDEVHAVVERGDHAEVRVTVVGPDLAVLVVAGEVQDRPPARGPERLVHLADGLLDLQRELRVALDRGAARRGELHEHDAPAVLRVALEEPPERAEALGEPLRVVHPLDADAEELGRDPELPQELLARALGRIVDEPGRDADRKGLDGGHALAAGDREALPVNPRLERAVDRLEEVVAVVLRVEADEVGAQHPGEQLRLPGADREGLGVRPRDVPEDRHTGVGPLRLDERGQQREVVVLDQDERLLGVADLVEQRLGKRAVRREVVGPVVGPEHGPRVHDVAERPEPLVREPVVVAVLLLLRQPHPAQRVARVVLRHAEPPARVRGLPVGIAAPVSDPHAAARAHHRIHRGHEPAGGRQGLDPPALPHVAHRFSVGHDDERPAGEAEVDELLEALLRPDGLAHQAQRGLLLRRRPGPLHAPREPRHLARQRAEDVGVGHVGWRHVAPGAEALRPLRHLRHRLRDAAPHDDQRDERDDERQSEEPERVAPPEVPRRALQVRGVAYTYARRTPTTRKPWLTTSLVTASVTSGSDGGRDGAMSGVATIRPANRSYTAIPRRAVPNFFNIRSTPAVESRATWGSIASLSPSPTRTARRFRSSTSRSRSSRICRNANPPMTISTESQMAPTRRMVNFMAHDPVPAGRAGSSEGLSEFYPDSTPKCARRLLLLFPATHESLELEVHLLDQCQIFLGRRQAILGLLEPRFQSLRAGASRVELALESVCALPRGVEVRLRASWRHAPPEEPHEDTDQDPDDHATYDESVHRRALPSTGP